MQEEGGSADNTQLWGNKNKIRDHTSSLLGTVSFANIW